jgi:hypothetical protein
MLREIQEPDRETVPESEIPTEPRQRAVSSTSLDGDSKCMVVQEPFEFYPIQTVEPTQQKGNQHEDSCSHESCAWRVESGKMYTTSSIGVLLQCLDEAAKIQDGSVSLLVHDVYGWHELFLNRRGTKTHGIKASYVRDIVENNDLDLWMESNGICADGDDEHEIGEIDRYQLVVYNQE